MVYENIPVTSLSDEEIEEEIHFTNQERKHLVDKINKYNNGIWTKEYNDIYNLMENHIAELYTERNRRYTPCKYCRVQSATLFKEVCADCYWDFED